MADYSKLYEQVTNKIIEEMEKGIIPWKKGWTAISGAYNARSKRYYSFLNQIILGRPGAYASFKQWNEMGCKIKKGEHSTFVMEWFSKKIEYTTKNADGEEEQKSFLKWYPRTYPVFHQSQVEGFEEPEGMDIKPADPIKEAEEVKEAYEQRENIKILTNEQSDKAFYSPTLDYIRLPMKEQFADINEFYSVMFHEMTHSTGHSKRLDRGLDSKLAAFGSQDYSKEELVAELGSAMSMARLGIDTPDTLRNSTAYLQGWLKALKNDKELIITAAGLAEKAVKYIFGDN